MAFDANSVEHQKAFSPRQFRHCDVSCGLSPVHSCCHSPCVIFMDNFHYPEREVVVLHQMNQLFIVALPGDGQLPRGTTTMLLDQSPPTTNTRRWLFPTLMAQVNAAKQSQSASHAR